MPAYTNETADTRGRRHMVATALFVIAALVVTYLPSGGQQQVAAFLRSTVLRPFVTTQETITTLRVRATEADQLRQRLDSLVAWMAAQGVLTEENRRLRGLLALSEKLGPAFKAATVVRAGTTGSESTFLVDAGAADGVRPNAPVISARGLVGVIRDARADHSVGMDWTHPDFRAGAMTADGSTYGMVESWRGRFREEDRLVLNGTAFHTRLEDGTLVVTSGLGGIFPRGVPIGLINGLAEAEGGWRKSYWLRPLAEPGTATHVLVAVGNAPADLSPVFPPDSIRSEQELARGQSRAPGAAARGLHGARQRGAGGRGIGPVRFPRATRDPHPGARTRALPRAGAARAGGCSAARPSGPRDPCAGDPSLRAAVPDGGSRGARAARPGARGPRAAGSARPERAPARAAGGHDRGAAAPGADRHDPVAGRAHPRPRGHDRPVNGMRNQGGAIAR